MIKIKIEEKNNCPEYVYKYCSRDVYEKHIKQGFFRLGTLADYREVYENKGAEYGDSVEGNPSVIQKGPGSFLGSSVGPEGGFVIDYITNAYVFSTALSYSVQDHEKWFQRKGCGYSICLKIRAKNFFKQLAYEIHNQKYNDAKFFVAKPNYNNGCATLMGDMPYLVDQFLVKDSQLIWEKEYRFICKTSKLSVDSRQSIIIKSIDALNYIESYKDFENMQFS